MAGILIHEDIADETHAVFQRIYETFRPDKADKLHISALQSEQQGALRNQIYSAIVELDLPCFWYALHVEGLYNFYSKSQQLLEDHKSPPNSRFKRGSQRQNPPSLHEELFKGLFCNVIAFLENYKVEHIALQIKTDRVDSPTTKRFQQSALHFLDDSPTKSNLKAWDSETDQIARGSVKTQVDWPDSLRLTVEVEELSVECADDGVTLAADVLVNSLNHLFSKKRVKSELYTPLNDTVAIKHHPLAKHLSRFANPCDSDIVGDCLFAHPKAPEPPLTPQSQ